MSRVSVLTGGAGGMGSATAKVIGRDHTVVLCDIRQDRLDATGRHPERPRNHPTIVTRDVTDPPAVTRLFETASRLGTITSVIHTAGVSPSMGEADYVMRTNALCTVNVIEAPSTPRWAGWRSRPVRARQGRGRKA
jgi:NAD(P)-dependent dehydrogenase (short-subunit alcohol dehydrogenase family)